MTRYAGAAPFRRALEDRLRNRARESGLSVQQLRKNVVFERLLARLYEVAPGRWTLKGAVALDYRLGVRMRATNDLDVDRYDDEEVALGDFPSS